MLKIYDTLQYDVTIFRWVSTWTRTTVLCDECGKELKSSASKRRHIEVGHRRNPAFPDSDQQTKDYVYPFHGFELLETPAKFFQHKQNWAAERTTVYTVQTCLFDMWRLGPNNCQQLSATTQSVLERQRSITGANLALVKISREDLDNLLLLIEKNHVCTICGHTFNKITVLKTTSKRCIMGRSPLNVCTIFFWEAKSERTHVNSHGEGWMNLPFVWQIHEHWAMRAQNIIAKEVLQGLQAFVPDQYLEPSCKIKT